MSADIDFIPAEAFPPGDFLREELAERGWTQADFAEILGKTERLVSELIGAKRGVTPAIAQAIAAALGTSAQLWLNLETSYRLYRESQKRPGDESVSRRAKLYSKAPVKEMVKRGWVAPSTNVDVLEKRICDFFEIKKIDDPLSFLPHAARKSASYESVNPSLLTWLYRARQLARAASVTGSFGVGKSARVLAAFKTLLHAPVEARNVSRILSEHGIRLIIVEPISKTRVDGVTFWLDARSPVIALSLRMDRIDWFWQTLVHELEHVDAGDGQHDQLPIVDDFELLRTGDAPEAEKAVSALAAGHIVDPHEMNDFIARTRPLYSKAKIENFAKRITVHPGIVVGQLQFRGEIDYSHSRNFLAKVREFVVSNTLTDGWGFAPLAL